MALTAIQELQVLNEVQNPGQGIGIDGYQLTDLLYQIGVGEAVDFLGSASNPNSNEDAQNYLNKVSGAISRVLNRDSVALGVMLKIIISIVGNSSFTFSQVQNADDEAWENLLTGALIPTVNMLTVFEIYSRVYPHEKTAYEQL